MSNAPSAATPPPAPAKAPSCVRYCFNKTPCGDACIDEGANCDMPPGTACTADKRPPPKFRKGDPARNGLVAVDIPAYNKYTLSHESKEALKTPQFDVWQWEPNEMLSLLEEMYHELGLVEELDIHTSTLKRFLLRVQENYRNNPFHNFRHAFCVTQMMYVLIHGCRLQVGLEKLFLALKGYETCMYATIFTYLPSQRR